MSEFRYDITTEEWVVFVQKGARRTNPIRRRATFKGKSNSKRKNCPYCPGNEHRTPVEIQAVSDASPSEAADWQIRVIAHQQPLFHDNGEKQSRPDREPICGFSDGGRHEVIIESPDHESYLGHQSEEEIHALLQVAQARFQTHAEENRYKSVLLFKSHGTAAGATLHHPHFQLIALPVVPQDLQRKQAIANQYFHKHGKSLYEDLVQTEMEHKQRVLLENEEFIVILPYASHRPFEIWILPRKQESSLAAANQTDLFYLAEVLKSVLSMVYTGLENPDFSLTIQSALCEGSGDNSFRWHIQLCPYLMKPHGLELASGFAVNTVFPEEATAFLRGVGGNG